MLSDTKSQCSADGSYCESHGPVLCGSQGLQVCEFIAAFKSNLIWDQIQSAGPTLSSVNHIRKGSVCVVIFFKFISAMRTGHQLTKPVFFCSLMCMTVLSSPLLADAREYVPRSAKYKVCWCVGAYVLTCPVKPPSCIGSPGPSGWLSDRARHQVGKGFSCRDGN